jgi:hypothetical protein
MASPPKSAIHINFEVGHLPFDARPIWSALIDAEKEGRVPAGSMNRISGAFGETAIHLATRHYIMRQAVEQLNGSLRDIYNEVRDPWSVPAVSGIRVINSNGCARARDRALLAIDSFLFEYRAYLDLLARFVHGVLSALGKGPSRTETLSSGEPVEITRPNGKLNAHAFLLYACDRVSIPTDWYRFLSSHRNFFTHEGAPYCAIEDLMVRPPELDLIIMKSNIQDFQKAKPSSYFRVSECQAVVTNIVALSASLQQFLIDALVK